MMRSIGLVIASLLLISLRVVLMVLAWPPSKLLQLTDRPFLTAMLELHRLLRL